MSSSIRRGLPRVPGGEPWPPEGTQVPQAAYVLPSLAGVDLPAVAGDAPEPVATEAAVEPVPAKPAVAPDPAVVAAPAAQAFRRGLPRVAGGEPWPPADAAPAGFAAAVSTPEIAAAEPVAAVTTDPIPTEDPARRQPAPAVTPAKSTAAVSAPVLATTSGTARRGLPRIAGGEPWPAEGTTVANTFAATPSQAPVAAPATVEAAAVRPPAVEPAAAPVAAPAEPAVAQRVTTTPAKPAESKPVAKAPAQPAPKAEPKKYGLFTVKQWVGAGVVVVLAIIGAVTLAVLGARWFAGLDFMKSFMAAYPGEYELPESAPVGFPGWLAWQHFFNIFLMVLIIRSGILVRRQERPEAFWASKKNPKKISIQLWLHQSLNILWVVNGLIFIILLFATGQWMRVIPTSPEVFPNALSAGLQYLTLDWPTDNGWVNYNSLQQLAYFATIFIAAPLSAITGYRMSESWPRESKLSEKFPVEWARAVHFPVMIYFVAFIVVHVALVFSTGALRNLNHMFAAQGAIDPAIYANNWTGFWLFVLSMVVVAGSWIAARPMVIAPIARIFGNISAR